MDMSLRFTSLGRVVVTTAFLGAVALTVLPRLDAQSGLPGLTDTASHPPPTSGTFAYNSFFPAVAAPYTDPVFGTTVRRISGDRAPDDIYGRNMLWNADATKFNHGPQIINILTGAVTHTVSRGGITGDAGFDPVDPNVYYYYSGSTIKKVVLGANGAKTESTFYTASGSIDSLGQSVNWMSSDGRFFIVATGGSVKVVDTTNMTAYSGTAPAGGGGGWIGMAPSGNHIIGYWSNQARSWKLDHVNKSIGPQVIFWDGLCGDHASFMSASNGIDYGIVANCNNHDEVWAIPADNNAAGKSEDAQRNMAGNRLLKTDDWTQEKHFTTVGKGALKDWAFVSYETHPEAFNSGVSGWVSYKQEIVGINVLTGEIRRLAHHRSRGISGDYSYQPRLTSSWGGEYIGWASNYNQSGGSDIYAVNFGAAGGGGGGGDTTPPTVSMTAPAAGGVAGTITVSADADDDTAVVGVQFKANGSNIGSEDTSAPYSINWNSTGVADGNYSITATARDAAGNTTTSSGVAVTVTNNGPAISAVSASSITATSATIAWTTNQASDTQVDYGTTTAYGTSTTLNATMVTSHSQGLTGLTAGTLYHYRVKSRNASNQITNSSDFTFSTIGPPAISAITISNVTGTSVQVNWSTNQASDSQVEYGTTTAYGSTTTLNSSMVTSHVVTVSGLVMNTTYHFRVRSMNAQSLVSTSADGTFLPTTPPAISAVTASSITGSGATITWTTDQAADTQVDYGTTTNYGSSTTLNNSMVTSHSQGLTGLSQATTYHYRVKSRNPQGALTNSGDFTFQTASAPAISGVASSNVGSSTATVSWTTNQAADSQIDYGTTTSYGSTTTLDATLVTSHSQGLSGLPPGTTYNYRVKSRNAAGLLTNSGNFSFTTVGPPTISAVSATSVTGSAANIIWTTNQAADTQVDYGTTTNYGSSTTLNATMATSHSQALSGLSSQTLYHYRVKSRNSLGLLATSADFTFTTVGPPSISGVSSSNKKKNSATITWSTNQSADSQIEYGTTTAYGATTAVDPLMVTSHGYTLTGLQPSTLYHYRVKSRNNVNLTGVSPDFTFSTTEDTSGFTLTVAKSGNGSGSVIAPLAGISCGSTCSGGVLTGAQVTLTAMPAPGSEFDGWSGACTGGSTNCTLTVTADMTVSARFTVGTAGDFDGDGFPDLVMQKDDGTLSLWLMQGNTRLSAAAITPAVVSGGIDWQILNPGATGGSGEGGNTGPGGTGGFQHPLGGQLSAVYLTTDGHILDTNWHITATPDLDGNGRADLLWQHATTGKLAAWIMEGAVKKEARFLTPSTIDPSWVMKATGDFNGDGNADILWQQNGTGSLLCWLMDGTTKIGEHTLLPGNIPTMWQMVGTADFDRDGQVDIVWQNSQTGDVYVWYMDGTSMRVEQPIGRFGDDWTVRSVGDFNADGRPDLIWQKSTGELAVWFMNGLVQSAVMYLTPGSMDPAWSLMGPR